MSELRDKATRLLLKSAWEMATLEGVGCMPSTPPDNDEMERLTADSGFTLDVLDKKAREVYDCAYSTTYQRYQTAIAMLIDDLLGVL